MSSLENFNMGEPTKQWMKQAMQRGGTGSDLKAPFSRLNCRKPHAAWSDPRAGPALGTGSDERPPSGDAIYQFFDQASTPNSWC